MKKVPIIVESYSGYKADEYPKSFYWHDKKFEIKEITDRWFEGYPSAERPAVDYFKVRTNTDMLCIIKHDIEMDEWYLVKIW
jgi:hypothetical protein